MKIPDGYVLMPEVPTLAMLRVIRNSEWPLDFNIGKAYQQQHGLEVVPPECNIEVACGQYVRLLKEGMRDEEEKSGQ